jgi:DNA-binding transcriptional LysR family regulator
MKPPDRAGRRLRIRDLHLLNVIADRGSMALAAEDFGLSQPAISKIISDIEKDIGAALFTRSSRGTEVTDVGRVLLRRGRIILDELRQGFEEMENLSDPAAGEVRVGIIEAWTPFVSSVVNRIATRYPKIVFTVIVDYAEELLGGLRDRTLDIVIARREMARRETDLATEHLFGDRLVVVCAHDHPLAARRKLSIDELLRERWALGPSDTYLGQLLAKSLKAHKLVLPAAVVTSNSVQMRLDLLEGGQFLTVYSSVMFHQFGQNHKLKVLPVELGNIAGPMAAITLKSRRPQGAQRLVLAEMRAISKDIESSQRL